MLKLLLLIALIGGGLWWFARGGRAGSGRDGDASSGRPPANGTGDAGQNKAGENMVRCEYCNTHVPHSAAVFAGKHGFCCEEHRAAAGY